MLAGDAEGVRAGVEAEGGDAWQARDHQGAARFGRGRERLVGEEARVGAPRRQGVEEGALAVAEGIRGSVRAAPASRGSLSGTQSLSESVSR